jgi:hypothetical protein
LPRADRAELLRGRGEQLALRLELRVADLVDDRMVRRAPSRAHPEADLAEDAIHQTGQRLLEVAVEVRFVATAMFPQPMS